jgi:tetratricopeptide (TPR) repeat protein
MTRDTRFWTLLLVFQVFFGLAVFGITREVYLQEPATVRGHPPISPSSSPAWSGGITATDISKLSSPGLVEPTLSDPAEISRRANEYFRNRQYQNAAQLYEQLLAFAPNDAEIYNNLGLTLFYIGRTDEALRRLNEGVAVDAGHQRIWLTLGYVNSQLGNTEQARTALTNATERGSDASIRESAEKMLSELP